MSAAGSAAEYIKHKTESTEKRNVSAMDKTSHVDALSAIPLSIHGVGSSLNGWCVELASLADDGDEMLMAIWSNAIVLRRSSSSNQEPNEGVKEHLQVDCTCTSVIISSLAMDARTQHTFNDRQFNKH